MRSLVEVIDKMKEVIPACEGSMLTCLNTARSSALFAAPELMYIFWNEVAECLEDRFGHLPEHELMQEGSWERKVLDIWMNKEQA